MGVFAAAVCCSRVSAAPLLIYSQAHCSCPLQAQFGLSQEQAEGVLGMTLRRLTSLETSKLQDEQAQLQARWALHARGVPLMFVCDVFCKHVSRRGRPFSRALARSLNMLCS